MEWEKLSLGSLPLAVNVFCTHKNHRLIFQL